MWSQVSQIHVFSESIFDTVLCDRFSVIQFVVESLYYFYGPLQPMRLNQKISPDDKSSFHGKIYVLTYKRCNPIE